MLYLLYVIAANWWTPMLVTGLTCLIVYLSSVLVSGCFYFCSFLYSLSSCFAGPGNILITATAMSLGWQMAKASLLFPCCCTGQAGSLDWNQVRGTVTFGWVHVEACTPWSICDHREVHSGTSRPWSICCHREVRVDLTVSVSMEQAMSEYHKVSVTTDNTATQQVSEGTSEGTVANGEGCSRAGTPLSNCSYG